MSRKLLVLIGVLLFLTFQAEATPPPAQGGYLPGWGMNPTNWQQSTGSFSAWGLYDPNYTGGGEAWVVGWNPTSYISYAPISLELWIEMYMLLTYQYTSYQWHRLGNAAETIIFTIDGTMSSNDIQVVMLTPEPGWNMGYLQFQHNIFGGNSTVRTQIPLSWETRWGEGLVIGQNVIDPWHPALWLCGNIMLGSIPACDHWFQFRGTFSLQYHEGDGYYKLAIAGCPYPEL